MTDKERRKQRVWGVDSQRNQLLVDQKSGNIITNKHSKYLKVPMLILHGSSVPRML